ncbi:D-2-hydroxyacid dehydrogenase [Brevibacterium permense]|uniref:D-2-hydroxyacid dehydrogenase n=1 Tax=Brevibacterium permense TaxID=234834 RepID=UPI0021D101E8|nr:D-2-hydroxyacid dehydrogenase [Brevibacterium permense]MCU4298822.1 D-2-hydroxyacid dehydrogenase [Brevibacterium permense]
MSKPPVIVLVPVGASEPPLDKLLAEADVTVVRTADELRAAQETSEILFINDFKTTLLREVGPGNLRWIHTSSIGVDPLLTPEIVNSDLLVSNSRGVCERPIAEWVLGVLIMFAKDLRRTIELQQERRWLHRETHPILGRRVVVVGPGPVGRETALLLRAAGMNVTIVGRSQRTDPVLGQIQSLDSLDEILPTVDDVVLTLPLTEQTAGMFDAQRIHRMRSGANLINVGRGAVVVADDLLEAIDDDLLGGAALDVFDHEPLPEQHPFWSRRNILVSPHASGDLVGWRGRVVDVFTENLKRWKAGDELHDVVDLTKMGVSTTSTNA